MTSFMDFLFYSFVYLQVGVMCKSCPMEDPVCIQSDCKVITVFLSEPSAPYDLKVDVSLVNILSISWQPGNSVLNSSHTVVVNISGLQVPCNPQSTSCSTDVLSPNAPVEIEIYSTIDEDSSVRSESTYASRYTCKYGGSCSCLKMLVWLSTVELPR